MIESEMNLEEKNEKLSLKDKLEITAKFLAIFASIAGGAIWLLTYVQDVNQRLSDRQRETIRYHELYNSKEILAARETFADLKGKTYEINSPKLQAFTSPREADELGPKFLRATMVKLIIAKSENKTDIPRLINFFEQLGICIKFELCDGESAKMLFKGEAYDVYYLLTGYVKNRRRRNPNYGSGLETLAYETGYEKAKRISLEMKRRSEGN